MGKSRGLLGRDRLDAHAGMLFEAARLEPFMCMHTLFMRFAIDVVFVDANGKVVDILHGLKPWRMPLPRFKAKHIIEMRGGRANELGIAVGDTLEGVES